MRKRCARGEKIELLESRCLLSAVTTISINVIGPVYSGTIDLHYHAVKGIRSHGASTAVTLEFSSLTGGTLAGRISAGSNGQVDFSGPTQRRSFEGVFADGVIIGTFTPHGLRVSGAIRETVDGELITGRYSAHVPTATDSAIRHHDQTSSTTSTTSSTSTSGGAGSASIAVPTPQAAAIESVSLPALETSFATPYSLNATTTSQGVATGNESVSNALTNQSVQLGTGVNTPGVAATPTNGTGNSVFMFSTSSGIVSITNSGTTFTDSSGIVSITAAPTYTPSSGISTVGDSGI